MEFHINRSIRERLDLEDVLFSYTGNVVFANVAASRRLATKLNELRGADVKPGEVVNAGALFAMGLIDELSHAMIARYRRDIDPSVLAQALEWFAGKVSSPKVEGLLSGFTEQFPNTAIFRGDLTPAKWLAGHTEDLSNREAAMEELMLLWLANLNPAFKDFKELFGDEGLRQQTSYKEVTADLPQYFQERPPASPEGKTLFEVLREPALASRFNYRTARLHPGTLAKVSWRRPPQSVARNRRPARRRSCHLDALPSTGARPFRSGAGLGSPRL